MKLHEFVAAHRAEILDCFAEYLKRKMPDAPRLDSLDDIAAALDGVTRSVRDGGGRPVFAEASAARHGRQRHDDGGRIEHVPHDLGTLCDAVFLTASRRGEAFAPREVQLFNGALDDCISSAVRAFWEQAQEAQDRARAKQAGLFARGLAITKLRAGVPVASERVRVAPLLRDLADAVLPARGVRLVVEADEDLEVVGDHALLGSAIGSLLQNALEFTREATTVTLRACVAGAWALVEVADECGGLALGDPEDLLSPLVQSSEDHAGTGLGLSIARDIAEAHGGELRVRDRPGVGCVFFLRLPATA